MNASNQSKSFLYIAVTVLAVVTLASATEALAQHHEAGRDDPWGAGNCTVCHGNDLTGGYGPSCMACHNDFVEPDPPAPGHHVPGRMQAPTNCTLCHGGDLTGSIGPSCYTCHDQLWDSGGGGNSPPDVDAGGPYSGAPGAEIQFDASGTTDPDGDTLTYLWLFGDGSLPDFPSQVPTTSHVYATAGTYTAILTVTDGVNDPIIVFVNVEIGVTTNLPPLVDAGGPYAGTAGQAVQFDASGTTDPDGDTLTYMWNFGDGSAPSTPSTAATVNHTYEYAGTYTAVLTVTDGVNTPVAASVNVEVIEDVVEPPVDGNGWLVKMPYLFAELTITIEEFAGVLLLNTTHAGGEVTFGIGMETDGVMFWMDAGGAIFFGNVDRAAGTMRGVVFGYNGGSSIFLAEQF